MEALKLDLTSEEFIKELCAIFPAIEVKDGIIKFPSLKVTRECLIKYHDIDIGDNPSLTFDDIKPILFDLIILKVNFTQ